MMRTLLLAALAAILGCSTPLERNGRRARCFTDSDCLTGESCNPFSRQCASNQLPEQDSDTAVTTPPEPEPEPPCDLCDDGFDCTIDHCDDLGGCVYVVAPATCLINGICRAAGEPSPTNPCRECLPSADTSAWSNDDTNACDDGDACTDLDACLGGACTPGAAVSCDDEDPCTTDSCDDHVGCLNVPIEGC